MPSLAQSLFPRSTALSGMSPFHPRAQLGAALDVASLPGRAYASLGRMGDESYLDALGRTGARAVIGQGEGDEMADAILRDPLTPVGLGLGSLLKGVRPVVGMAADLGTNAAGMAADQYATTGRMNAAEIGAGAGMGALLGLGGMAGGGKRAMISPEEREANFRNWFGDSKVVDRARNPIPMYHGTNADFSEFKPLQHFGTQKAAHDRLSDVGGKSESIMPVYVSAENPLWIDDNGLQTPFEIAIAANRSGADLDIDGYINKYIESLNDKEFSGISKRLAHDEGALSRDDVSKILQSYSDDPRELVSKISRWGDPRDGDYFGDLSEISQDVSDDLYWDWDALAYSNAVEDKGNISYIPLSPTQIKSATGNRGTFDPNDPNITHFAGVTSAPSRNRATTRLERQAAQVAYDKYGRPREESAARPVSAFQGLGSLLSSPSDTYYTRGGR